MGSAPPREDRSVPPRTDNPPDDQHTTGPGARLLALVDLDRQYSTDCPTCGWTGVSATPAGAVVLEEHHRGHCRLGRR